MVTVGISFPGFFFMLYNATIRKKPSVTVPLIEVIKTTHKFSEYGHESAQITWA